MGSRKEREQAPRGQEGLDPSQQQIRHPLRRQRRESSKARTDEAELVLNKSV